MHFIELNDASRYEVTDIIKESTTELKGVTLPAIEFEVRGVDADTIRSKFTNEFNTRTVRLLSENKTLMTVYNGYSILRSIATNEQEKESNYVVVLAQTDDVKALIPQLNARIKELEAEVIKLTTVKAPEDMELDELKTYLVAKSKENLELYLSAHPISSTVHGGDIGTYSCTLEKQTLLNNAIAMATIHEQLDNTDYKISWNQYGQPCTHDWTKEELVTLAIQIEAFVKPLISAQQTMENEIMTATTTEEALSVVIVFSAESVTE